MTIDNLIYLSKLNKIFILAMCCLLSMIANVQADNHNLIKLPRSSTSDWDLVIIDKPNSSIKVIVNSKIELESEHWNSLQYGVDIPLLVSLELFKSRWFWLDKVVASVKLPIRIRYDNFLEKYQANKFNQIFYYHNQQQLIDELLVFEWLAIPLTVIQPGEYQAQLSLEIDHQSLPDLLHVNVFKNKIWRWKYLYPEKSIVIPDN